MNIIINFIQNGFQGKIIEQINLYKFIHQSIWNIQKFSNEYLGSHIIINNNNREIYSSGRGKIYKLDDNLNVINSKFFEKHGYEMFGELKFFTNESAIIGADRVTKENKYFLRLVKEDLSFIDIEAETQSNDINIFDDEIIIIGYNSSSYNPYNKTMNKVIRYNLDTNKSYITYIGDFPNTSFNHKRVDINKNKIIVIGTLWCNSTNIAIKKLDDKVLENE